MSEAWNPHPVPPHMAGIAVFLESVVGPRLHVTLYQTGPIELDAVQALDLLRAAVRIAEEQLT